MPSRSWLHVDALKGHLDGLPLAVVAGGPCHGYAIIEQLRRRSLGAFDLPEGTVYPAAPAGARRPAGQRVGDPGRPQAARVPAHRQGPRRAGRLQADWQGFAQAVEAVFGASA